MKLIDLHENATKDKILAFSNLGKDWHFGEGVPPTKEILKQAVSLSDRIAISGFRSNAFPGVDGEIMVTVYHGKNYLEFTFEADGTVTFVREKDETEIAYEEKLTFDQAKNRLNAFGAEKIWKSLSGLSTANIMTQQEKRSIASPLRILPDQGFHPSLSHASTKPEVKPAPIFASIMKISRQTQSSSGGSGKGFYLMDAFSNNIQAIPEMFAMAI